MELNHPFARLLYISWSSVPKEVRQCVKLRFLDFLGCALAGWETKAGKIAVTIAKKLFPGEDALILAPGCHRSSILGAAFANATLASALDLDDGYRLACGHPGSVVIPAALAVGEVQKISGQKFLEAILVGYEIATRTGQAMYTDAKDRFWGSGAWASSGAAAAAAFLLSLPENEFTEALGIAEAYTPLAPALKSIVKGSMVKESIGWGALTGVASAFLAKEGFTGVIPVLLEPPHRALISDIGESFRILDTYLKTYAACRWAHPAIEGVKNLLQKFSIKREKIVKICVETFSKALTINNPFPTTPIAAQYSLPFAVAAFLQDGVVGPDQVSEEAIVRKEILELAKKIEVRFDEELEARFPRECLARVIIMTAEGESYQSEIVGSPGDPERPLTYEAVKEKFRWLARKVLAKPAVQQIEEAVETLEKNSFDYFINILSKTLVNC